MKMKVNFEREVTICKLLTALEQTAKDMGGECFHVQWGRDEYLLGVSPREEIKYRLENSKITFPFTDLKTPFFKSTKLAISFGGSSATGDTIHYYGISQNNTHKVMNIKIRVLGKATGPGWLLCSVFTCIPVIGWISLFKFFNRRLSSIPMREKEQVTDTYHQYFDNVSEHLKYSVYKNA